MAWPTGDRIAAEDARCHNRFSQLMDDGAAGEEGGVTGTPEERLEDELFGRVGGDEGDFVHPAPLPDAVDAAAPLMQPRRRPGQLVMDDEAAGVMQIQPLRRRIRGHHHHSPSRKLRRRCNALVRGETAVEQHHRAAHCRNPLAQPHRRVAVFRKDDGGGGESGEEAEESRCLAFGGRRGLGGTETLFDSRPLAGGIVEALSAEHAVGVLVSDRVVAVVVIERQPGLRFDVRQGGHRCEPSHQREGQRACARQARVCERSWRAAPDSPCRARADAHNSAV